jgi:hypothetical protein
MPSTLKFASHVPSSRRTALEALVFFNSCQIRVIDSIVDAIERYGTLEIVQDGDRLSVTVAELPEAQSFFAIDDLDRPVGVAIFMRADMEQIIVLHIGVAEEFASGGRRAHEQLLLKMLRELRRCGRRMKGVRRIQLFYRQERGTDAEAAAEELDSMTSKRRRQSGVAMRRIT